MSKERPISFSYEMVRAILEGRKTQTRRVLKPQPVYERGAWTLPGFFCNTENGFKDGILNSSVKCPYGKPGDQLWVREAWGAAYDLRDGSPDFFYQADSEAKGEKWKTPIHMPRIASRITLEITDVRVERLSVISWDDAKAEGVLPRITAITAIDLAGREHTELQEHYLVSFADLWDSINRNKEGCRWYDDPWVWVIKFKKL